MKRLFAFVQEYISTLSILEFGALKLCLMCLGLMLGTCVKSRHRRPVRIAALFGFVATLIPLMLRFFSTMYDWFDYTRTIPTAEDAEMTSF